MQLQERILQVTDQPANQACSLLSFESIAHLFSLSGSIAKALLICFLQLMKNSSETLALTFAEFCHIRNVITRAELETLLFDDKLYNEVAQSKVKVRWSFRQHFSWFPIVVFHLSQSTFQLSHIHIWCSLPCLQTESLPQLSDAGRSPQVNLYATLSSLWSDCSAESQKQRSANSGVHSIDINQIIHHCWSMPFVGCSVSRVKQNSDVMNRLARYNNSMITHFSRARLMRNHKY